MSCATCSARASIAFAALPKYAARCDAGSRDHAGNASRADSIAAAASSAVEAG